MDPTRVGVLELLLWVCSEGFIVFLHTKFVVLDHITRILGESTMAGVGVQESRDGFAGAFSRILVSELEETNICSP